VGFAIAVGALDGCLNGSATSPASLGSLGVFGIVVALFATVALAAAVVVAIQRPRRTSRTRVAGSWIAAIGLLRLGWWLRAA
jgi:hypothetical protein